MTLPLLATVNCQRLLWEGWNRVRPSHTPAEILKSQSRGGELGCCAFTSASAVSHSISPTEARTSLLPLHPCPPVPGLQTSAAVPDAQDAQGLRAQTPSDCHTMFGSPFWDPHVTQQPAQRKTFISLHLLIKWTRQGQAPICVRRWWLGPTVHDTALLLG